MSSASKVPEALLGFWVIKVIATTLGETGGDAVTMTLGLGYIVGTAIFVAVLVVGITAQIRARRFNPALYWAVIVATTTAGTTLADFLDRSLGIGYAGGSSVLFGLLLGCLGMWHWTLGAVSADSVSTSREEAFYWATIMFSQTLGTALGDWTANTDGLGYSGGALVFGTALVLVALLAFYTSLSRNVLFWLAFILTRPLGATLGDFLDKPLADGGLHLGRFSASVGLLTVMAGLILLLPQRAGRHPGSEARPL